MRTARLGLALSLLLFSLSTLADERACGSLERHDGFGPFDYRSGEARQKHLEVVERYHFNDNVKQFRKENDQAPGGHIDYTLRAFPNHAPALRLMVALAEKEKTPKPLGAQYSVSCYFDRALRFQPDDVAVHLLYGMFLAKNGHPDKAMEAYRTAEKLDPENANIYYNMGLLYFDLKEYGKSMESAKKAYELGFPLAGLKNKLQKIGKWEDKPAQN